MLPAMRSKNGRARVTPLVGLARALVKKRLQTISEGPLFLTERGTPLDANCVSSLLVHHRKYIPIPHFTSHDLRRTVATGLVDLGFPLETVAVLGHEVGRKDVRTLVRHYVRSELVERKRAALEAWSDELNAIVRDEASTIESIAQNSDPNVKLSAATPVMLLEGALQNE